MRQFTKEPWGHAGEASTDVWTQRVGALCALPALIRQLGGDPDSILGRAGLAPGALDAPEARVPFDVLCRALQAAAEATQCAHLGLLAGRIWRVSDLGLVGELVRYAPTVREALHTMAVHQHLNSGGGLAYLIERGGAADIGYAIYQPGVAHAEQMNDGVLAAWANVMRELCGPGWLPSEVFLPHARPVNVAPYRQFFKVQPTFNAEICALRFPANWLDRPIEGADPVRRRIALQRATENDGEPLTHQVFRALRVVLLHGKACGDDVAGTLSMHRRTLNRRLKAHGTTYQQVLDQVRLGVACQLLADSDISLDDVAATLGYAGVSPFMRTFRRWTGTTPGCWRRTAAAERRVDRIAHSRPSCGPFPDVRQVADCAT
jgi:AraC-like DNA-binding protein